MKLSVFGLFFLAALFCSLQLASGWPEFPGWAVACKIFDPQHNTIFCRPPGSGPGNQANVTTGNGTGAPAESATEGSAGAARSLPILGSSLPIGTLLPIR